MALICRLSVFKCPTGLIFRVFNNGTFSQKCLKFSSKTIRNGNDTPIKYSTNRVAKVEIAETIGMKQQVESKPKRISKYIIFLSFATFMVYFCILREENDIDEILRGGTEETILLPELMKLKMDLTYCQKMKLPTDVIKARIEELEKNQKVKSPYVK